MKKYILLIISVFILVVLFSSGEIQSQEKKLIPFLKADKFGFVDQAGEMVVPSIYDDVKPFCKGYAVVCRNELCGLINTNGEEIIPPKYDNIGTFAEDRAKVELHGKSGFIDKTGKEVIALNYNKVENFQDGIAVVTKVRGNLEKFGVIDKEGNEIAAPIYDWAGNYAEGMLCVELIDKYGYIDKNGEPVIRPMYEFAGAFSEGLALIKSEGLYGYINKNGDIAIPAVYREAGSFNDGYTFVSTEDKVFYYIDSKGQKVFNKDFVYAESFHDGFAIIGRMTRKGFGKGVINAEGKEVIAPEYSDIKHYEKNRCLVKEDGKVYFIDDEEKRISNKYLDAWWFEEERARVMDDYEFGFINKEGNETIPLKYKYAFNFKNGFARVKFEGAEFYIDQKGHEYYEK